MRTKLMVLALALAGMAGAQNGVSFRIDNVSFPGVNPCNNELIEYTGYFQFVSTGSNNENSQLKLSFRGVGSFGNQYVLQDNFHSALRTEADGVTWYPYTEKARVVSSTNAPNYFTSTTLGYRIDPVTGEATQTIRFKETCQP